MHSGELSSTQIFLLGSASPTAMLDFSIRFCCSPPAVAEWPVKIAVLPESIGNEIHEMNINDEYASLSRCNPHGRSLEESWKLIDIDGDGRTLKNRKGIHFLSEGELASKSDLPKNLQSFHALPFFSGS